MGLLARVDAVMKRQQTWPLGPGVVELGDSSWGHAQDNYAPAEYGDYIATSNAVYACATLRARLLSSLPLLAYRLRPRKGKEAVESGPVVDLLKTVNPFWCVDDSTEALTKRGWLRGDELTTEDTILSMRSGDGQLTWSPVRSVYREFFQGDMVPLRSQQIDALVTPGHKFATVTGTLTPVEALRQGDRLRTMGTGVDESVDSPHTDALVELVGWFVTEGYLHHTKRRMGARGEQPVYGEYRSNVSTIGICQKDGTARCERIRLALSAVNATWSEQVANEVRRFEVTGSIAAELQIMAPGKVTTPRFLVALSPRQRGILIDTMIDGDGSRSPNSTTCYFIQRRRDIVDAFVMLCALDGRATAARVRCFREGQGHLGRPVWIVSVLARKTKCIRRTISERVPYSGMVWCPETDYGTFVCRRNDIVYVTGNTFPRLVQQVELSLCLWGQSHLFLERGTSGRRPPSEMWWGRPDRVRPVTDPAKYISSYNYYPDNSSTPIEFAPSEVVWLRLPNPLDEFSGLSPLAAARLPADYASAAMKANKNLFEHGLHMGGMISLADKGQMMTREQADEISNLIDKRYRGADNAHRWMVLRAALNVQGLSVTPKDADYLGGMKESLEQICRAYNVPIDLIGGQRTYENVEAAMRAVWNHCIKPEATLIATELTEQLLPMFGAGQGGVDLLEFDFSAVEELKEEETEAWTRWKEQIASGAVTINEWREEQGLDSLEWGDVWWAPSMVKPVENGEPEPPPPAPIIMAPGEQPPQLAEGKPPAEEMSEEVPADEPETETPRMLTAPLQRGIAYGSDKHRAVWATFVARTEKQETRLGTVVADLFRRQRDSLLAKMRKGRGQRVDPWDDEWFDTPRWIREFRERMRPVLRTIVEESGNQAIGDVGLGLAFDVVNPAVTRFIEQRAQRFAKEVNDTTWQALKDSLAQGMEVGEDMDTLANRVEQVMGDRIESSKDVIARTEVIGASNGGTLRGWEQAQDLIGPMRKHWLAAIDDRTRDTHIAAHEQYNGEDAGIPLEEDFQVGAGSGPAPGQIGIAAEDCNCRCTIVATQAPF